MFASYLFSRNHQYSPLPPENKSELPASSENHVNRRQIFIQALFVLETIHLIIVLLAFAGGHVLEHAHAHSRHELDNYFDLFQYNTVKSFYGEWSLMNRTAASDALFDKIQESDGVVAIDTEWALVHGYAPSVQHPQDTSKSIYQIDMFHSMHCIFRLRNKLTSHMSLEDWPRDDEHTLHCLDYVREQLLCNADLTLEGTDDLLHFNKNSGHVCRSSDAVTAWAAAHHWSDHRQFLKDTQHYE